MLQKQQLEVLKNRRKELVVAVHFYKAALEEILSGWSKQKEEGGIKTLLQECESNKKILQDIEELIMSLEITEKELHYNYTASIKNSAEVACLLMEYATDLNWLLMSKKVTIYELQNTFLDFQKFIRFLFRE